MPAPSIGPTIQRFLDAETRITGFINRSATFHEARAGGIRRITSKDYYLIVEIGFLGLMLEWEIFIEETFCRLLCNGQRSSNPQPHLLNPVFRKIEVARSTLHGARGYARWIDPNETSRLSNIYFLGGEPFETPIRAAYQELEDAQIIRNRIGHSSARAETTFSNMIQTKYGYRPKGMTPGRFLLDKLPTNPLENEYTLYAQTLITVARLIVG